MVLGVKASESVMKAWLVLLIVVHQLLVYLRSIMRANRSTSDVISVIFMFRAIFSCYLNCLSLDLEECRSAGYAPKLFPKASSDCVSLLRPEVASLYHTIICKCMSAHVGVCLCEWLSGGIPVGYLKGDLLSDFMLIHTYCSINTCIHKYLCEYMGFVLCVGLHVWT